jgi:hypothetical protein
MANAAAAGDTVDRWARSPASIETEQKLPHILMRIWSWYSMSQLEFWGTQDNEPDLKDLFSSFSAPFVFPDGPKWRAERLRAHAMGEETGSNAGLIAMTGSDKQMREHVNRLVKFVESKGEKEPLSEVFVTFIDVQALKNSKWRLLRAKEEHKFYGVTPADEKGRPIKMPVAWWGTTTSATWPLRRSQRRPLRSHSLPRISRAHSNPRYKDLLWRPWEFGPFTKTTRFGRND